ncbi:MAG TPA: glutamine--fructose-6-phosphate transaminase (isomerizing) [Gammaproteobacteria bacterium]
MCGIVGYVGPQNAAPILLEGLRRLEYRGYDSAGLALSRGGALSVFKKQGTVADLEAVLPKRLAGRAGIGHTRWATHGAPLDRNAHPHTDASGRIAVVHNGIIENARELKATLEANGARFASETDTEVLAHLIAAADAGTLEERVRLALANVAGSYGLLVLDEAGAMVAARNGSPVLIGIGEKEMFVASDAAALIRHTQRVVYLEDGEIARVDAKGYTVTSVDGAASPGPAAREAITITWGASTFEKGDHAHYMLKEIMDQPAAVEAAMRGRLDTRFDTAHLGGIAMEARELQRFRRITVLGCGSAYISGFLGARLIESLARLPCDAVPAAEFRYRNAIIEHDTLYVAVSQSGETFDTLAAVQEIRRKGGATLGVVNVVGSSIARACGRGVYMHAGPEISVVSTKTFACTLAVFALLALYLGRMKDLSPERGRRLVHAMRELPETIAATLSLASHIEELARRYARFDDAYYIGRDFGWALAMEGALKLKEVAYVHAEAYPASELKHGPLALVSPEVPTIAIVPDDHLLEKNLASIEEIRARKGPVLAVAQRERLDVDVDDLVVVPALDPVLDPILMLIPLQLFAYYLALETGRSIDRPRNLAKSVTVE